MSYFWQLSDNLDELTLRQAITHYVAVTVTEKYIVNIYRISCIHSWNYMIDHIPNNNWCVQHQLQIAAVKNFLYSLNSFYRR